jgi:4-hydroxymandelate oxidase
VTEASGLPEGIHCARDYEHRAAQWVSAPLLAHVAGGAGRERTLRANLQAFESIGIEARLLGNVRHGHTRTRLLGQSFAHPVMLAPVAFQALFHPMAECETARAAAATDTCLVASTLSSCSLEDIAATSGLARWFQLYLQPCREHSYDLVKRAHASGYRALVVTLDAPIQAPSLRALRAGFRLPANLVATNLTGYPPTPAARVLTRDDSRIFQGAMAQAPDWDDLRWLLDHSPLPVVAKGVTHPQDAEALREAGVAGLVVSNHGGRALDGTPSSLQALTAIRRAIGQDFPILLDSGVRSGADIFKAVALGADAVMIGRLQVYALAAAGALGVAQLIRLLREELELCMALAGCATLADINPQSVRDDAPGLPDTPEAPRPC